MDTLDRFTALRTFIHETEKRSLVYGVSFPEYLIMRSISHHPLGIKRVDLANLVGLSISGVTRALAPLEKGGYIETSEQTDDARVRKVTLSTAGKELFVDIDANVLQRMEQIEPELNQLIAHITK